MQMLSLPADSSSAAMFAFVCISILTIITMVDSTHDSLYKDGDMSLWIDEVQVKQFFNGKSIVDCFWSSYDRVNFVFNDFCFVLTGIPMKIYAISDGVVLPYVLDPNFEKYLPAIPSEVMYVNFTWKSGENKNYYYDFDELQSFNTDILKAPVISVEPQGIVPKKPKVFQVFIPCVGNTSGNASFTIGLKIVNADTNQYLTGTPIRLKLHKQCTYHGPDPECDKKCGNGKCNQDKICVCPTGSANYY